MPSSNQKPIPSRYVKGVFSSSMDNEIEASLAGSAYLAQFKKMYLNDAIIGGIMLAITKLFQSIEWKAVDDPKGVLQKSLENVSFKTQLEEILKFLIYGHAVFEITLQEEPDGRITWGGFHTRPQDTIVDWEKDENGRLIAIKQVASGEFSTANTATLKLSKCLYFANCGTPNRPEGRSIIRNSYRDWYYKTNIEKIEAIGIERDLTGLPVLTPSEDAVLVDVNGALTRLGNWAWETVRQVKRNEQEGLVLPFGWTFQLQGSPGQRQFDLNKVIDRYDAKIAMSMLGQFLILGVINEGGSFALAKEQSELFHKAMEGFANMIAEAINRQFIGAPVLGQMNGYAKPPRLVPIGASRLNLSDLASFLGRLFKFNVITPDDKLEDHLRRLASLPEREPSTARVVQGVNDQLLVHELKLEEIEAQKGSEDESEEAEVDEDELADVEDPTEE